MSIGIVKATAITLVLGSTTLAAEPLRTVHDASRDRTWVLQPDGVYLNGKRFELPGWINVGDAYACGPDLAIDAEGRAVVTSNVVPIVWRVEPAKAQITKHELVLDADADKDIGFTGLTYAADQGVFFAVSATYGSLWRIDPLLRRAQKVPLSAPVASACGLSLERTKTRRMVVLCTQGEPGARTIHLTSDQRSAYVFAHACAQESAVQSKL